MTDAQSPADAEILDVTEGAEAVTETDQEFEAGAAADPVVEGEVSDAADDDSDEDSDGDEADDSEGSEDGATEGGGSKRRGTSLRRLEEEGEVAADYLEELLDIADIDGDIDIDVENGRASVGIVTESSADRSLRRLVGPNGEVLEALQELTRLAVQAATGERSRLMLDVAGFRANRRRTLEGIAARACQEVQRSGEPQHLEPMSAFERKVVHDVVADAGLVSESEGEDPRRHVVIKPA